MPALIAGGMVIATVWAAVIGFAAQFEGPIYSTHLYSALLVGCVLGVAGPILLAILRACIPSIAIAVVFVTLWVLGGGLAGYAAAYHWYSPTLGC